MTKNKKILFLTFLIIVSGYFLYKLFFQEEIIPLSIEQRNLEHNTAQEIKLEGGRTYTVDNKKFKQGYYDISCIEGSVKIDGVNLSDKDQYLGVPFYFKNEIKIEGEGTLLFSPAKFKTYTQQDNLYIFENKSVILQVGKEIEEGTYSLEVENKKNTPYYLFVAGNNYDDSEGLFSFDIRDNKKDIEFSIKEGDLLKILNFSDREANLKIKLIKKGDFE